MMCNIWIMSSLSTMLFNITFYHFRLQRELKESQSSCVCPFVFFILAFMSLSGLSQVSLRSLSQVFLSGLSDLT